MDGVHVDDGGLADLGDVLEVGHDEEQARKRRDARHGKGHGQPHGREESSGGREEDGCAAVAAEDGGGGGARFEHTEKDEGGQRRVRDGPTGWEWEDRGNACMRRGVQPASLQANACARTLPAAA